MKIIMQAPSGRLFDIFSTNERDILLKLGWKVIEGDE